MFAIINIYVSAKIGCFIKYFVILCGVCNSSLLSIAVTIKYECYLLRIIEAIILIFTGGFQLLFCVDCL